MTDDPLEKVRSQHRYEVSDTFTDEEDDVRIDEINQFLKDNPDYHEEIMKLYKQAIGGKQIDMLNLYQEVVALNNILANRLNDEEHEELREKIIGRREDVVDKVPPDELFENIDQSKRLRFANGTVRSVMRTHGTLIKSYCFSFVSGTRIASESGRGGF